MHRTALLALLLAVGCEAGSVPGVSPLTAGRPVAGSASWAPWPQAEHDGRRSAASPATGPQTGAVRWTRHVEGNVTPGPVIGADGTIYAASNAGVLHALDPRTGNDRWSFDGKGGYGLDQSTSAAVLADRTVLWPGPRNLLYALSPAGRLMWTQQLSGQPSSPAVASDGQHVTIADSTGSVLALEVHGDRHRVLWKAALHGSSYSSVALSPTDPHRAYTAHDATLVALDDGQIAWTAATDDIIEVSPAVAPDGTVVVGTNDSWEWAFTPSGARRWRFARVAQSYSSPGITDDGIVYFGDHKAYLTGLDVATGRVLARYRGPSVRKKGGPSVGIWTSPVVDARHDVYWGTRSGHVLGVAPDGHQLFDLDTGATVDSYPALGADGLLVVGVTDGRLLGIGR